VWRRDVGGPWRVVLDHGVSHEQPETSLEHVELREGPPHASPEVQYPKSGGSGFSIGIGGGTFGVGVGSSSGGSEYEEEWRSHAARDEHDDGAERSFTWYMSSKSAAKAYRDQAAADLRFYRNGRQPSLGPDAAIAAVGEKKRERTWTSRGNGVAKSWDLGYSYGIVVERASKKAPPDTSSYVHLWRKDDTGHWKMALERRDSIPEGQMSSSEIAIVTPHDYVSRLRAVLGPGCGGGFPRRQRDRLILLHALSRWFREDEHLSERTRPSASRASCW
jgi:ketosteroid isomerase-like protein